MTQTLIPKAQLDSTLISTSSTNGVSAAMLATNAILLGYTPLTATVTINTATFSAFTGLTSTVTVPSGGRSVKITLKSSSITINALDAWAIALYKDGTAFDQFSYNNTTTANANFPGTLEFFDNAPTSGSHTYAIYGAVGIATHVLSVNAGNSALSTPFSPGPAYILVEVV